MNSQKGFVIPLIIAVVAILAVVGGALVYQNKAVAPVVNIPVQISTTTPLVGGDKDSHGCIGSAGYSWCAEKNKCLRVWEEKCEVVATSTSPLSCTCPEGYVASETICNPKCFYSTPRCLMPSVMCTNNSTVVDPCPQFMPPAPDFCAGGKIVNGGKDANGCQMPPKCEVIACTMDAMMCPDGTYVGRSAPDCKFICPTASNPSVKVLSPNGGEVWKIGTSQRVSWGYNGNIPSNYKLGIYLNSFRLGIIDNVKLGIYDFILPNELFVGDVVSTLTSGSYKITINMYDGEVDLGNGNPNYNWGKVVATDSSNNYFEVK